METINTQIGVIGYFIAALFFFVLNSLQIVRWRKRLNAPILFALLMTSVFWAGLSGYYLFTGVTATIYLIGAEVLRNFLAFLFLIQLAVALNPGVQNTSFRIATKIAYGSIVFMAGILLYVAVSESVNSVIGYNVRIFGHVVMAVIGLLLVEQVFRQSKDEYRWAMKYLCFAFFAMFAFDFYLYSDAMLFNEIDPYIWQARGYIYAVSVVLLGVALSRSINVTASVSASRNTVFYTTAAIVAAIYLIVMSAGGFYLQAFGGDWGKVIAITVLFSAFLLLFIVIFSGSTRARLRVFIDKHFLEYKYDYREQWLGLIRKLSTSSDYEKLEQHSLEAVMDIMDCTAGSLWIRKNHQFFVPGAIQFMDSVQDHAEGTDSSLARFLETWQWVVNLDEYHEEPGMYSELSLPNWLTELDDVWLIVPLMLQSRLYGFVVLSHPRVKKEFNWEDIDLLKTVGRQIAIYLAQERSALALVQARQFEAFNRFSAYVVHDLKNLVSQLALVVKNAEKHKHNPEFMDDAIRTVDNAVERMNKLLAQLRAGAVENSLADKVDLKKALETAAKEKSAGFPKPSIEECQSGLFVLGDESRLVSVLGHLIQNAQDATPRDGKIELYLHRQENSAVIKIKDTGCGMDEEFIKDRLFKPFDTTKGLTGMGIGAHESRAFVEELGGSLEVESQPGDGTIFSVYLPLIRS